MSSGGAFELIEEADRRVLLNRSRGFVLVFDRHGESWSHHMGSLGADGRWEGGSARLLASVEALPERLEVERIVSPTYQDLHVDRSKREPEVLLVGQYGPHRYSAVFSLECGDDVGIVVDLADRCRQSYDNLACTYQLAERATFESGDQRRLVFGWPAPSDAWVQLEAAEPASVQARPVNAFTTLVQVLTTPAQASATHRCRYALRWRCPVSTGG